MLRKLFNRYLIGSAVAAVLAGVLGLSLATYTFGIGVLYHEGYGVGQDFAEAAKWFRKAADDDHAEAQAALGTLYAGGRGVPQNFFQAAHWFRAAAEQGLAAAQFSLGLLHIKGLGVGQNRVEARKWLDLAARQDVAQAREMLSELDHRLSPEQRAEGARLADQWLAEQG